MQILNRKRIFYFRTNHPSFPPSNSTQQQLANSHLNLVETPEPKPEVIELKNDKEKEILDELKSFIKNSENMYSAQKNDLVNLINEVISDKHATLRNQLDQIVETKFDRFKNFVPHTQPQTNSDHMLMMMKLLEAKTANPVSVQHETRDDSKMVVEQPKKKGKYQPLTSNLWAGLLQSYPDLPTDLADKAYIRDNEYFIKLKSNFIKVDQTGVARIVNYYKNKLN